jgi:hypothetical protein
MRIFYILLSTILLMTSLAAKSQVKVSSPETDHKVVKKFYPNPAVSFITFELDKEPSVTYTLLIYSFIGKQVKSIPDIQDRAQVPVSELNRGLYTFQLKDQTGHVTDSGIFQVVK